LTLPEQANKLATKLANKLTSLPDGNNPFGDKHFENKQFFFAFEFFSVENFLLPRKSVVTKSEICGKAENSNL
jgi:hypothetical protein